MLKSWFVFILIFLSSCAKQFHLANFEQENIRFEQKAGQEGSARIDSMISPYKLALDDKMNIVIGEAETELIKERVESTLGNWVADALVNQAEIEGFGPIDFAAQNYGGIRIPGIPKGDVTIGKIYELMPFDNIMVIMECKGDVVMKLMERIAEYGGWPVSWQIKMVISDNQLSAITLHGESIDPDRRYRFILPDYIANGGDNCDFLIDEKSVNTGLLIRDLLIGELKYQTALGKKITAVKEGRILKN